MQLPGLFISYARLERAAVYRYLPLVLIGRPGFDRVFLDDLRVRSGESVSAKLEAGIRECDKYTLFWSRQAARSRWVAREIAWALERWLGDGRPPGFLNLVRLDDTPLPGSWPSDLLWIDLAAPVSQDRRGLIVHFLDHHMRRLAFPSRRALPATVENALDAMFKASVILAEVAYVPAVSYFEHELCKRILNKHRSLWELGRVRLACDATSPQELAELRMQEYGRRDGTYRIYQRALAREHAHPPFAYTGPHTTRALHDAWRAYANETDLARLVRSRAPAGVSGRIQRIASQVQDRMADRAFLAPNLLAALELPSESGILQGMFGRIIGDLFFEHFGDRLGASQIAGVPYFDIANRRGVSSLQWPRVAAALECHPEEKALLQATHGSGLIALGDRAFWRELRNGAYE